MSDLCNSDELLIFWFEEAGQNRWFKRDKNFDELCRKRFLTSLEAASRGECWRWRVTPAGRCAEIILLDQFSRNLYRNTAASFANDGVALTLAQEVVAGGHDHELSADERYFSYMPYMHSESLSIQQESLRLFEKLGQPEALRYAHAHFRLIERFGRYPHRNSVLGRTSTEAEQDYLKDHKGF
ncbi:MAG: DUF924 family protein [Pseudomonadota bacterium]